MSESSFDRVDQTVGKDMSPDDLKCRVSFVSFSSPHSHLPPMSLPVSSGGHCTSALRYLRYPAARTVVLPSPYPARYSQPSSVASG